MLDLSAGRNAVLSELDSFLEQLATANDDAWQRPVRCEGWVVRDLAMHMVPITEVMAKAFHRMIHGSVDTPALVQRDISGSPAIIQALQSARSHLAHSLSLIQADDLDRLCPLLIATMPGMLALQVIVTEAGIHTNDLAWALGNEVGLPDAVITAAVPAIAAALPALAQRSSERPNEGLSYRLLAPRTDIKLLYQGGVWRTDQDVNEWTCTISGDDSAVLLFACGRIPAQHGSLRLDGDVPLADRFKRGSWALLMRPIRR